MFSFFPTFSEAFPTCKLSFGAQKAVARVHEIKIELCRVTWHLPCFNAYTIMNVYQASLTKPQSKHAANFFLKNCTRA